jgi:transposase
LPPAGYIYPKAERAVRDLLLRRLRLVRRHTANLVAVQDLLERNRGRPLSADALRRLTPDAVERLLSDANVALVVQRALPAKSGEEAAIDLIGATSGSNACPGMRK